MHMHSQSSHWQSEGQSETPPLSNLSQLSNFKSSFNYYTSAAASAYPERKMKPAGLLLVAILCVSDLIGPSCCFWGRRKVKITSSAISSTSSKFGIQHRVGRPDDSLSVNFNERPPVADYDAEAESLELDGSTVINGSQEEERLFNMHPLHVFMKKTKKKPFVKFSTTTATSTVTALVTLSTVGLCAQLVNVTGPCRMRKGLWVQDPIVLSFDDEMDSIDGALTPSKPVSIEPTARPEEIPIEGREISATVPAISTSQRISGGSDPVIHSSKEDVEELKQDDEDEEEQVEEGRFGYFGLKKKFKKKIKFITVVTTTALTRTSTSTSYITISTKTFFIQICTPSPFPFEVCNVRRKKREIEFEPHQFEKAQISYRQSKVENTI